MLWPLLFILWLPQKHSNKHTCVYIYMYTHVNCYFMKTNLIYMYIYIDIYEYTKENIQWLFLHLC